MSSILLKRLEINILGLALYGPMAASHRVRIAQYREGLAAQGVNLTVQSLLGDKYLHYRLEGGMPPVAAVLRAGLQRVARLFGGGRYHAAIVHCELFPFMPVVFEKLLLRIPYIYDFDDAWYLRYKSPSLFNIVFGLDKKFPEVVRNAVAVTAGNNALANYAKLYNQNVTLLPSVVDTEHFRPRQKTTQLRFTLGWIGSFSTSKYLDLLRLPLSRLAQEGPVRFVIVGGEAPVIENVEIIKLKWNLESEVELINSFDVGLMPLRDDEWSHGKSAFKLVQYMACGIPVVASRVGANIDLVTSDCGFLVDSDDDWLEALRRMRDQPLERINMGLRGRERVEKYYSLSKNLTLLGDVIRNI